MLGQPVRFSGECGVSREIGTEDGAVHRGEIGGPVAFCRWFDVGGPPDVTFAGGQKGPEDVLVNKLDGAG